MIKLLNVSKGMDSAEVNITRLYTRIKDTKLIIIIIVYLDNLFITRSDKYNINQVKGNLMQAFKMIDRGLLHYYL